MKGHALGRIVPPASIGTVPVPGGKKAAPYRLATGPDGTVWFTDPASNAVGRLTPDGQIVGVQLPHAGSDPYDVAVGPDGIVWFTEAGGNRIGKLDSVGQAE